MTEQPIHPQYEVVQPTPQRDSHLIRTVLIAIGSGMGIVLAIAGLEFADYHEPTIANALAGHQLYSDAGTIRTLSTVVLVLCVALLVWEFLRRRR
jgi:hypothetical protein